jgi:NADPH-dependent 2,4-dienoyl-CoA reductase/sulfur reductase-like enzyme
VVPKELSLDEIQEIQDSFVKAAERAQKSGFDGVEIHSAHGYLIGQFISPASNKREDMYGGSLENKARFALDVIEKVRAKTGPDFMIGFRFSADEYVPGGLTIDESALYARIVAETGKVDYISVSAATYESVSKMYPVMYSEKGCLLYLSERVKKQVGNVPVIAVGAIDARTGERALREGKADMVAIGRGLIADPELPDKIAAGKLESIRPCIRCNEGCFTNIASGKSMRCAVNPACGREKTYRVALLVKGKKVMVIGGGIAGMEAARMLALRGHKVTLVEKSGSLGGHLIEASVPTFKQPLKELLDWEIKQLSATGITVRMNTEATPDYIRKAKPDVLIVAVGSDWNKPFTGGNKVVTGEDVLSGKVTPGERVVVMGGGSVGCETALHIAAGSGKKVIIVEMLNQILTGLEILHMIELMERLANAGVEIRTGLKVIDISDTAVICEDAQKQKCEIAADTVVTCTGLHARKEEAESFKNLAPEVYSIGDCVNARRIMDAFEDAHHAVLQV